MRMVAEEAGVSTGMLNHYFANRQAILTAALVHVSECCQERYEAAIADIPAGRERLEALLDSVLAEDDQAIESWRVWIIVSGEAVHLPELRRTVEERLKPWHRLLVTALEGVTPPDRPGAVPWGWRLDGLLYGLTIQAMTSEADLDGARIRDEVVRMVLAWGAAEALGADADVELSPAFAD
jgi:AcrR family transcriptional regulator